MTDAEINRALALAIGWQDWQIGLSTSDKAWITIEHESNTGPTKYQLFDYRDPEVIWAIAERFNCFPYALRDKNQKFTGCWNAWASAGEDIESDTAAKAVALAVIKAKETRP